MSSGELKTNCSHRRKRMLRRCTRLSETSHGTNPGTYDFYRRSAQAYESAGRIDAAWACLEAAHILGQRRPGSMSAWRTRDRREFLGQLARLLAAALATWLWVPTGNTGRSDVSPFKRLPLSMDLAERSANPQQCSTAGRGLF